MARPAFRKVGRPEEGEPRLAHLDRDRRLVEAAQADPAHFEALYRKYLAQVYSFAYYELRDHHEAEDATERTFLAALANLARFEERARPADGEGASTFRVWLFQIARNALLQHRRKNHRLDFFHTQLDPAAFFTPPPCESMFYDWIQCLPEDEREICVLRYVDDLDYQSISDSVGIPMGTVKWKLHQAKSKIANLLNAEVGVRR